MKGDEIIHWKLSCSQLMGSPYTAEVIVYSQLRLSSAFWLIVLLKCFRKKKRQKKKLNKDMKMEVNKTKQNKCFQTLKERINLHIWKRCTWEHQELNPTARVFKTSYKEETVRFPEIWRMAPVLHAIRSIRGDKKSVSGNTGLFHIWLTFMSYLTYHWVNWFVSDLSSQFMLPGW